ncbi:SCO3933 family regulatory protein [Streptosporangium vulgare]|uniref:Regulatory protein n=1 Tax=Streptosporangium vulgare TaxID=46190 RepID=A0ABV5TFE4_9ACTN
MRNIPIPVDVHRLRFTCVKAARPRVVDQDTGKIKTDKEGNKIYESVLLAEDELGRIELVKVGTSGQPPIAPGQDVVPTAMVGYVWEIPQNGASRWGISYKATSIVPVSGIPAGEQSV